MQGRGTLVKYDGSLDHYGDFLSDSKHGMGVEIRDSDKKFALVGTWQNDKLEGEVLIVNLPDCREVRKAIFRNDKKVAQLDQHGPQRAINPDGRVIEVTLDEIDQAIGLVRHALEEFT